MHPSRILTWLAIVAAAVLATLNLGHIEVFSQLLGRIHWYVLALVVVAQVTGYYCDAKFYQSLLAIFNYHLPSRVLFEMAVALNFVGQAFPSAGVSGVSFFSLVFKDEVPAGKLALAQLLRYAFTFVSYLGVLVAGFLLLFLLGGISKISVKLALLFQLVMIMAGLVVITIFASDRSRV